MAKPIKFIYKGVWDSISGHARRVGLGTRTVSNRIRRLGTLDPAVILAPVPHSRALRFRDPSGHLDTIAGHARRLGMDPGALRSRYKTYAAGRKTLKELFDPFVRRRDDDSWMIRLTHDGITDTIAGWARRCGVKEDSFRFRLIRFKGRKDAEQRIFAGRYHRFGSVCLTHDGETLTLAEWSRRTGISYSCLSRRFRKGATPAQALAKGNWHLNKATVRPAHGNHTRRKLAALGIFA